MKDDSPSLMDIDDPLLEDPDPTTEVDSDSHAPIGQKRAASGSFQDSRYIS